MRMKDGFVLREIAGDTIVIATGEAGEEFYGMVRLNTTGKQIWQGISEGMTAQEIAHRLTLEYAISEDDALKDVKDMIEHMKQAGFLCE